MSLPNIARAPESRAAHTGEQADDAEPYDTYSATKMHLPVVDGGECNAHGRR